MVSKCIIDFRILSHAILQVPFVPVIPGLSILLNIYLILMLDLNTWIRFTIWMAVGKYPSITVILLLLHSEPLVMEFLPLLIAACILLLLTSVSFL